MYNEGYKNAKQHKMSENFTFTMPNNKLHMPKNKPNFAIIFILGKFWPHCGSGSITGKPRAVSVSTGKVAIQGKWYNTKHCEQ